MIEYAGLGFLLLMTLNAWGWMSVVQSRRGMTSKLLWTVILLIPLVGFLAWFLIGPRRGVA